MQIKNLSELGASGALYFLFGYALTYGGDAEDHSVFIGMFLLLWNSIPTTDDCVVYSAAGQGNYALVGMTDYTNFLFSFSFAMSTATIISGAVGTEDN